MRVEFQSWVNVSVAFGGSPEQTFAASMWKNGYKLGVMEYGLYITDVIYFIEVRNYFTQSSNYIET